MTHHFTSSRSVRACTPLCEGGGSRCKSSRERHLKVGSDKLMVDSRTMLNRLSVRQLQAIYYQLITIHSSEAKADTRAATGWKPDGSATSADCGACPLTSAISLRPALL